MLKKIYLELVAIRQILQAIKKDLKYENQLYCFYKHNAGNLDIKTECQKLNQYIEEIFSL